MELTDVYNERYEKTNVVKDRHDLGEGEYRIAAFVWIINSKGKILVQQRSSNQSHYPNLWCATSGGVSKGERSIDTIVRELKEELNVEISEKELSFIGTYKRINDYVDTFLLEKDIAINEIKLQPDEVQSIRWMNIDYFEKLINRGLASDTSFYVFKNYYENYYKREVIFIDGKPVLRKINN